MPRSESLKAHCAKPETKAARSVSQKKAWDSEERRKKASETAKKQGQNKEIIEKRKKSFSEMPVLVCDICGLRAKSHAMKRHAAKCGTVCSVKWCTDVHHMKGYCRHHFKVSHLAAAHGISADEMFKIFKKADGKCEICSKKLVMHGSEYFSRKNVACLDHCHATGKVRGILCFNCNSAIGHFSDDVETVRLAVKYLSKK